MILNDSIRTSIVDIVNGIIPFDPLEEEHIRFTKNWIASGVKIFRKRFIDKVSMKILIFIKS